MDINKNWYFISKRDQRGIQILHIWKVYIIFVVVEWIVLSAFGSMLTNFLILLRNNALFWTVTKNLHIDNQVGDTGSGDI
jgi:hypothetical protein